MEQKFYICEHCKNIITKVKDSGVPVMCCGQKMTEIVPGHNGCRRGKACPCVSSRGQLRNRPHRVRRTSDAAGTLHRMGASALKAGQSAQKAEPRR